MASSYNLGFDPVAVDTGETQTYDQTGMSTQVVQQSPLIEGYTKEMLGVGQELISQAPPQYGQYVDAEGNPVQVDPTTGLPPEGATWQAGQRVAGFSQPQQEAFDYINQMVNAHQIPMLDAQGNQMYDEAGQPIMQTQSAWDPYLQAATDYAQGSGTYFDRLGAETEALYGEGAGLLRGTPQYDAAGNITGYTGGVTPEALSQARSGVDAFTSTLPGSLAAHGEAVGQWTDVSGDILETGRGLEGLLAPHSTQAQTDLGSARTQAGGIYDEFSGVQGDVQDAYRGMEGDFAGRAGQVADRATGLASGFEGTAADVRERGEAMQQTYDPYAAQAEQAIGEMSTQFDPLAQGIQERAGGMQAGYDAATGASKDYLTGATGQFQREDFDTAGIQQYMDPYTDAVKQAAFRDIDEAQAKGLNVLRADAAGAGAFGGARMGLAEGETIGQAIEQKSQIGAELDKANYAQALQAAMGEHQTGQAAAQQAYESQRGAEQFAGTGLANLAGTSAGLAGQEAGVLSNLGAQQAGISGQQANMLSQLGMNQAGLMGQEAGILGNLGMQEAGLSAQEAGLLQNLGLSEAQIAGMGAQGLLGSAQAGIGARQAAGGMYGQLAQGEQALGMNEANVAATGAGLLSGTGQTGSAIYDRYGQNLTNLGATEAGLRGNLANQLQNIGLGTAGYYGQLGQGLASLGQAGAGVGQAISSQMGGIGGLTQNYGMNAANAMLGAGGMQRDYGQSLLNQSYSDFMQPYHQQFANLGYMANLINRAPTSYSQVNTGYDPQSDPSARTLGAGITAVGATASPGWST